MQTVEALGIVFCHNAVDRCFAQLRIGAWVVNIDDVRQLICYLNG